MRDTARLSQRYPPIARYGVLGVTTWPIGCDTPSPFSERFPLGEHAKSRCDTPPPKGYLSDTGAIPYENKANGCDTPLCDTISEGYCAIWGGISHWAAKPSTERQKRGQNSAPVLVIISGKSLAFSRRIITSTGFYRCYAPGASAPVVVKNQSPSFCDFRQSSTQLLVCGRLSCLRSRNRKRCRQRYGPDTEIQYQPREPHGLAKTSRILSKTEADTEFQYRPHIVHTDTDCGRHLCGRHFRDSCSSFASFS